MQTQPSTENYQNSDTQNHRVLNALKPNVLDTGLDHSEKVTIVTCSLDEHSKEDLLVDFGDTPLKESANETSASPANGNSSLLLDQMLLGDFSTEPTLLDLAGDSPIPNCCDSSSEPGKETIDNSLGNDQSSFLFHQMPTEGFSAEATLLDFATDASSEEKELESYLEKLQNEEDEESKETVNLIQQKCDEEESLLNGLTKEDVSTELGNANNVSGDNLVAYETCLDNEPQRDLEEFIPSSEHAQNEEAEENFEADSDVVSETETAERSLDSDMVSETETAEGSLDSDAVSESGTAERSLDGESEMQNQIPQISNNEESVGDVPQSSKITLD